MKFLVMEVSQPVGKCGSYFFQNVSCRMSNSCVGGGSSFALFFLNVFREYEANKGLKMFVLVGMSSKSNTGNEVI